MTDEEILAYVHSVGEDLVADGDYDAFGDTLGLVALCLDMSDELTYDAEEARRLAALYERRYGAWPPSEH